MNSSLAVLLIDDSADDAELLIRQLRRGGYQPGWQRVFTADDMRAALDQRSWDIIISDYVMPQFSALAALHILQQSGQDIPFIIVSGSISEEVAVNAIKTGANDYVMKDNLARLSTAVTRELADASLRRDRQQHQEYLNLLNEITKAAASILDTNEMLRIMSHLVKKLIQADEGHILLWDEQRQRFHTGLPDPSRSEMTPSTWDQLHVTAVILNTGHPLTITDTHNSAYLSPTESSHIQFRALLGLPLIVTSQRLGVLLLTFRQPHTFTTDEISRCEQAVRQIALATARAQLYVAEREQRLLSQTLREVAMALNSSLDRTQVLNIILQQLMRVVAYDSASILLLTENQLESIAYRSLHPQIQQSVTLEINKLERFQAIIQTAQPGIVADTAFDDTWQLSPGTETVRCWLGIPLLLQGRVIGILNLNKTTPNFYTAEDSQVAMTFASQAALALENARLYAQQRDYAASLEQRVTERTFELQVANIRLQELDRLKSKFVSDVTHELRHPMAAFRLYLDLLDKVEPAKQARFLQVLREQAERLSQLVDDILSLSRLERERHIQKDTAVDLNLLVAQVVNIYRTRAEAAGLQLTCDLYPDLPLSWGNNGQLMQVVTNLVNNAINYTPHGSVSVSTYLGEVGKWVCVQVKDTGVGIDPAERPLLFDRFYRGERTRHLSIPGTGLGLAIVREIMDMHQGRIELHSSEGDGSTFILWLPIAPPDSPLHRENQDTIHGRFN